MMTKLTAGQRQAIRDGFAYSGHTRKRLIEKGYAVMDSNTGWSRKGKYGSIRYHLLPTESGLLAVKQK